MTAISAGKLRARRREDKTIKDFVLTALFFMIMTMVLIALVMPQQTGALERTGSMATYENLMSGTFHNDGTVNRASAIFEKISATILRVALPFMSYYALTMMVIALSATVIYLSNPSFWDKVHQAHLAVQDMKKTRRGIGHVANLAEMVIGRGIGKGGSGVTPSLVLGVLIPDIKVLAFQEASELGPDGRPSLGTFVKYQLFKFIMLMAMIIMVNDRTLMDLIVSQAEVGVFITQKLAYDVDYTEQLTRFVSSGKKYDPGWKGGKRSVFDKTYTSLLGVDKAPGTEKEEYKQMVGSLLSQELDRTVNKVVDFDGYKVASHVRVDTVPFPQGQIPQGTWQWPVSKFGVQSPEGMKYVTLALSMTEKSKTTALITSEATTYEQAWKVSKNEFSFDLSKTDLSAEAILGASGAQSNAYKDYRVEGRIQVIVAPSNRSISITTPQVDPKTGMIKANFGNALDSNQEIAKIMMTIKPAKGTSRQVRYVNNAAVNKELESQGNTVTNMLKPGEATTPKNNQ